MVRPIANRGVCLMQIRLLQYFVTLASEKHFARAAQICGVTQPTLSSGIAALEEQLGKRLVVREHRFMGLTLEGEAVLPWAQQLVADYTGLQKAAEMARGPLRGELRLGAIPASLPVTGHLAKAICDKHPELAIAVHSLTSREIERGLAAFELDAAVTYLDHEPPANVISVPLYTEQYMYIGRAIGRGERGCPISWAQAVAGPLCLLHRGMQNRRILDAHLAARGLTPQPKATSDSYVALFAMVQSGGFATIIPDTYAALVSDLDWAEVRPFADPFPPSRIGLVMLDRSPVGPLAKELLSIGQALALPSPFARP
ncbi:LysR family transcriptional regulator [Sphingomonas sp. KC8]|nr:LysR family transcriptional regulator [Sphingomonas sp. KC8]